MAFDELRYAEIRPYLFHLTARSNLERLLRLQEMQSAAVLLQLAEKTHFLRLRRPGPMPITIAGDAVLVRDQSPLHEANIGFSDGWTFGDLIEHINQHVFFWSGSRTGPVKEGLNHYGRYESEAPVILRFPFRAMRRANPNNAPLFCRYNSGAPRFSGGRASPRGPQTFTDARSSDFLAGDVKEVVFRGSVVIPRDAEIASDPLGPWQQLWR